MNLFEALIKKDKKLAVIGLGYVGLPIALEFSKHISVVGYDISADRVALMNRGIDPSNELDESAFQNTDILFTSDINDLAQASFFIIAVPTPVDEHKVPDLNPIIHASKAVGQVLKKGDYVVYESTVFPGCTEETCVPVLEATSGLSMRQDFMVGYSPERINPGDKEHTITKITKVVSACCDTGLEIVSKVYSIIVEPGVFKAKNIKVAEAAKVIENTQRDVNIALMNELSKIFDKIGINTYDVLEAAGTKWNFLKFSPGLVGGHCIGVDPYYLTYKASELNYTPEVILSGRHINDTMGVYIAQKCIELLLSKGKNITHARILVWGVTFKENVSDIRNSKVVDVIDELKKYTHQVDIVDPLADKEEMKKHYNIELSNKVGENYDIVLLAVPHNQFLDRKADYFQSILSKQGCLVDIKGVYRNQFKGKFDYWSL